MRRTLDQFSWRLCMTFDGMFVETRRRTYQCHYFEVEVVWEQCRIRWDEVNAIECILLKVATLGFLLATPIQPKYMYTSSTLRPLILARKPKLRSNHLATQALHLPAETVGLSILAVAGY